MTENLTLDIGTASTPKTVVASRLDGTTFSWTPTSCANNGTCALNGNTVTYGTTRLYSWIAATAESTFPPIAGVDAAASICPTSWRLPANYIISPDKSYTSITDAYGATVNGADNSYNRTSILEAYPLNFYRYGYANNGSPSYAGTVGIYWSSTGYNNSINIYEFYYSSSYTYPTNSPREATWGVAVRCVAL